MKLWIIFDIIIIATLPLQNVRDVIDAFLNKQIHNNFGYGTLKVY